MRAAVVSVWSCVIVLAAAACGGGAEGGGGAFDAPAGGPDAIWLPETAGAPDGATSDTAPAADTPAGGADTPAGGPDAPAGGADAPAGGPDGGPDIRPEDAAETSDGPPVDRPITVTLLRCDAAWQGCAAPAPGEEVSGSVHLLADTGDGGPAVTQVALLVDGARVGLAEAPPFEFRWDTTTAADGDRLVRVVATGGAGPTAEDHARLHVNNCDRDHDGHGAEGGCGGDDCDDDDPDRHPGAPEVCDDRDEDCDGDTDEGPCDDEEPCTDDRCEDGACRSVPNTAACEDGSACTVGDRCDGGGCVPGEAPGCDDRNPCTDDGCDPAAGCFAVDNQRPCDDGDPCTGGDVCAAGACTAGPEDRCGGGCRRVADMACGGAWGVSTAAALATDRIDRYACAPEAFEGPELSYRIDLPADTQVVFAVGGEPEDRLFLLPWGTDCDAARCVASAGGGAALTWQEVGGASYWVVVDSGAALPVTVGVTVSCYPRTAAEAGESCVNAVDDDWDGRTDCADADCVEDPLCLPRVCGDEICHPVAEDADVCPEDCAECGDGVCSEGFEVCDVCRADCGECPVQGCASDLAPSRQTCGQAAVIGRLAAAETAALSGDTTGDGNDDDLSTFTFQNCWDANADNFYRVWLAAGDRLDVVLDPLTATFNATLKLYSGLDCEGGADGDGDLLGCFNTGGDGAADSFSHTAAASGWVTVVVDGRSAFDDEGDWGAYALEVTLTCVEASCGCPR